ncbi:MAG TPA: Tm-1-like ATP-binding domain-containing protein [Gemmataceae bacterium]|nr:Tm-1-like ATP-binding domain-containing protein [Gemmataceae bacterium]
MRSWPRRLGLPARRFAVSAAPYCYHTTQPGPEPSAKMSKKTIALSTGPHTRPAADAIRRLFGEREYSVRVYEADGRGGRDLEADVLAGRIAAVLDLTLTELAAELLGEPGGAGPDRLTAAAIRGAPQVIVPGGLDAVNDRQLTPEEHDRLGREIANKASAARGPTTILIPIRSVSPVLVLSLRNWLSPAVRVRELELHINDPEFAAAAVTGLERESLV